METWTKSQKVVQGIAVYIVLTIATAINDHYKNDTNFWVRVIVGAILVSMAIFATSLLISWLYKRK